MKIEVSRENQDRLSRKFWVFDYDSVQLRLLSYHEQERATTRHKFKGPKWDYMDERPYYSKLDRPTEIPADILAEAKASILDHPIAVHIGWTNDESRIGYI